MVGLHGFNDETTIGVEFYQMLDTNICLKSQQFPQNAVLQQKG